MTLVLTQQVETTIPIEVQGITPDRLKDNSNEEIAKLPIWAFHGDKDGVCPYERDLALFEEMQELGGNMKLTTWEGDNHAVSAKMITGADNGVTELSSDRCNPEPDFLNWLFAQKRHPDDE